MTFTLTHIHARPHHQLHKRQQSVPTHSYNHSHAHIHTHVHARTHAHATTTIAYSSAPLYERVTVNRYFSKRDQYNVSKRDLHNVSKSDRQNVSKKKNIMFPKETYQLRYRCYAQDPLQHTATHCTSLQHTETHTCRTRQR